MGTGTLACTVKEGVKLYVYRIRTAHVERARDLAIETALADAVTQGLPPKDATKQARKKGSKATKQATEQADRIIGPMFSSGWDFFEDIYYGGTITEGFLTGSGTLVGTYAGGFLGEKSLGNFGYLIGSHLGSWVGNRIGLMMYDVIRGVHFLLQFVQNEESDRVQEIIDSEYPNEIESPLSENYESPPYENYETYENPELR